MENKKKPLLSTPLHFTVLFIQPKLFWPIYAIAKCDTCENIWIGVFLIDVSIELVFRQHFVWGERLRTKFPTEFFSLETQNFNYVGKFSKYLYAFRTHRLLRTTDWKLTSFRYIFFYFVCRTASELSEQTHIYTVNFK